MTVDIFIVENFKLQSDLRKVEEVSSGCLFEFVYTVFLGNSIPLCYCPLMSLLENSQPLAITLVKDCYSNSTIALLI